MGSTEKPGVGSWRARGGQLPTPAPPQTAPLDSEVIKQSILDIESVVQKIASLCENKHMLSVFNEVSHIAHVSTSRLSDRLSYL